MDPNETFEAYRHDLPHFTLQTVHCTDRYVHVMHYYHKEQLLLLYTEFTDCLSKGSIVSSVKYINYYIT